MFQITWNFPYLNSRHEYVTSLDERNAYRRTYRWMRSRSTSPASREGAKNVLGELAHAAATRH